MINDKGNNLSRSFPSVWRHVTAGNAAGCDSSFHLPERRCHVSAQSEAPTAVSQRRGQLERMSSLWKTSSLGSLVSLRWNGPLRRSCKSWVWGKTCSFHVLSILVLSAVNRNHSKALFGLFYLIFMSTVAIYREVLLPLPRVFLLLRSILWEC